MQFDYDRYRLQNEKVLVFWKPDNNKDPTKKTQRS